MHAPDSYAALLPEYFASVAIDLKGQADFIQAFYSDVSSLIEEFPQLKAHVTSSGQLWISWPKKAAKVATELNDNVVREVGLANGLVDVKIIAFDETWSAMKFVYRLKDR